MRVSLGAYPTDTYYDPNRPSWLPYWLDDSAESAAKYGTTDLAGQMGGVVGAATGDITSGIASAATNAGVQLINTSGFSGILLLGAAGLILYALIKK